ncbi:anti-sigma factor [Lipingzhangella sp. LS1_29]|uniref:Anti-sigma factor n=1 Tax=Lipingzhangella rawalii TaxID=2055835 RepID=A0ABU2H381_9ACTN|nr:anti-sigma factor [Lipingzhangella rawalii]MDS1269761.1 anti-sigma factor [Lipingzhangella rawalii]
MSHLGERLSALVDGELGPADREEALRHLAVCANCRFEAEMLRQLKRRLHGLHEPEPAGELMGRIAAASETADDSTETSSAAAAPQPDRPSRGFLAALMRRGRNASQEGDSGQVPLGTRPPLGSRPPIGGGLPRLHPHREGNQDDTRGADAASS